MPRQPRLDAPGTLHHVMGRGIEETKISRRDLDREDFLSRPAELWQEGSLVVYAWALMGSHFHLLDRTGRQPLSRSMRKILTVYVIYFNSAAFVMSVGGEEDGLSWGRGGAVSGGDSVGCDSCGSLRGFARGAKVPISSFRKDVPLSYSRAVVDADR